MPMLAILAAVVAIIVAMWRVKRPPPPVSDGLKKEGRCRRSDSAPLRSYLQKGQQPVAATFVAAAAPVVKTAKRATSRPNSLVFIVKLLSAREG